MSGWNPVLAFLILMTCLLILSVMEVANRPSNAEPIRITQSRTVNVMILCAISYQRHYPARKHKICVVNYEMNESWRICLDDALCEF